MDNKIINIGIFLVHSLEKCGIGGMETHQNAFISHYVHNSNNVSVSFPYIIENEGKNYVFSDYRTFSSCKKMKFADFQDLINFLKSQIPFNYIFLNDGWWIESISIFKSEFPLCHIFMRSGGNDAELAPWNFGIYSYKQRRSLWRESINKLDRIIANSDFSASRLISLGVEQHRIIKVRGGVNEYICQDCRRNKKLLRHELVKKLGITQKYILIFASRFVLFKGIIPALECIKKSRNIDNCHILFVGSGQLSHSIEEWCLSNLRDNQFSFIGELSNDNTIRLIAASDILVNTSILLNRESGDGIFIHTETMGRSMMEAISVGTKIIATNVGGTNELFKENEFIGYLTSTEEKSLINTFNMIEPIINERTGRVCDYSWKRVFNCYDKMFINHE